MKGKIICIVIALMVLSIGAIIGANPNILGGFSSTLNGVPVQVTISRQDNGTVTTMLMEDLLKNWADYDRQFVRFMGIVESVDWRWRESKKVRLTLDTPDDEDDERYISLYVHPLDAPHLPTEYQEGNKYEFTGFLTRYLKPPMFPGGTPGNDLYIYAFEIRHHALTEADHVERLQRGD